MSSNSGDSEIQRGPRAAGGGLDVLLENYEPKADPSKNGYFVNPDASGADSARLLYDSLMQNHAGAIKLREFPDQGSLSIIEAYSLLNKDLSAVIFEDLPNSGEGFKEEDVAKLRSISERLPFVWYRKERGEQLVFHDGFFMTAETIPHFDYAKENKKTVSLFGSARYYDPDLHYKRISNALDSVKRVLGDECFVFHGGGPGVMQAFSEIARDKGIRVGSSAILLDAEKEMGSNALHKDFDAIIVYENSQIASRQKNLLDAASAAAIAFNPGGMGTVSEIVDVLNNNSIYGKETAAIIVGDKDDCVSGVVDLVRTGKNGGTVRPWLRLYHSEDGNLDGILRNHYSP